MTPPALHDMPPRGVPLVDVTLRADPVAAREARHSLRRRLMAEIEQDALENLELLTSELVTNSFRHACPRADDAIRIMVFRAGSALRLEVADAGPGFLLGPKVGEPVPRERHWGLVLVDRIAARWGVGRSPDGITTVWAEVLLPRR